MSLNAAQNVTYCVLFLLHINFQSLSRWVPIILESTVPALVSCPRSLRISNIALQRSPFSSQKFGVQPANSQAPTAPTHTHKHLLCIIFHTITWTTEIFWCVSQCIIICTIPSITMRSPNSKDWPWPAHNLFI